jgi:putative endonuclease
MKQPALYIITNKKNGTLYVCVTSHLEKRMHQHTNKVFSGFSKKYTCTKLVYYELFHSIVNAINAEKKLKSGSRKKKIELIEKKNILWNDLYEQF